MKILAIDTSSEICSVAILEDERVIDEINLDNGRTHSENLMPLIDEILKRNNFLVSDINLLACSVGPGSFTGIRIGVSSIKPIAEVLNLKIASVTSLVTLARNVEGKEKIIVSLIDARNDQVYCGVFDSNYNKLEEYMADDINEIINSISKYSNITFVGDGAMLHQNLLQERINDAKFKYLNLNNAYITLNFFQWRFLLYFFKFSRTFEIAPATSSTTLTAEDVDFVILEI